MSRINSDTIPGEVVFKLYDTHGFPEDVIERVAALNRLNMDKEGFTKLLHHHKSRHKTAFKEQTKNDMASSFNNVIKELTKNGITKTEDDFKYNYKLKDNNVVFKPLESKLVSILNENGKSENSLEVKDVNEYYLVTEKTNFYCEEGGQMADKGVITVNKEVNFKVDSVFKIKNYIFHKGKFEKSSENKCIKIGDKVVLEIDNERRLNLMRNHTGVHLLNAAIRKVLPNSVVCQTGSNVSDEGFVLNLSVYGDKLTDEIMTEAQDLVR